MRTNRSYSHAGDYLPSLTPDMVSKRTITVRTAGISASGNSVVDRAHAVWLPHMPTVRSERLSFGIPHRDLSSVRFVSRTMPIGRERHGPGRLDARQQSQDARVQPNARFTDKVSTWGTRRSGSSRLAAACLQLTHDKYIYHHAYPSSGESPPVTTRNSRLRLRS